MTHFRVALALVVSLVSWSCRPPGGGSDGDADTDVDGDGDGDVGPVSCSPGEIGCAGTNARQCNESGDGWVETQACGGATPVCAPGRGCVVCLPDDRYCDGNNVMQCSADGMSPSLVESCEESRPCMTGACRNPCAEAESADSYEGCDYWAVTMMNSQVAPEFLPAVVISNRNEIAADVTVTRAGAPVGTARVEPNSTATIELPWVMELKQEFSTEQSVNVPGGAYHVTSTLPVTVYQFNPLRYRIDRDCANEAETGSGDPMDGQCHSYSNDASLLLPRHVLTEHYIVMSRPNLGNRIDLRPIIGAPQTQYSFSPSVLTVVNPGEADVQVELVLSSPTQRGPGIEQHAAGDRVPFTVAPGGVLQIAARIPAECNTDWTEPAAQPCAGGLAMCTIGYCSMTNFDLTGTEITASAPVAVFGGHNCAFVPYNRWACDHLEEQLFPYETWGKHFVVSQSRRENNEPDVFRVLSGGAGNTVTFSPAAVHEPVELDRGQFVEFEARGAFEITSEEPVLVGQFIVGQSYNPSAGEDLPPGDPSFSLGIPVEQYRSEYNFLTPDTYDRSFVNITASSEGTASIQVDGADLAGAPWEAIEGTSFMTLRHEVPPGSHVISSSAAAQFGIVVYGYGQYTSYMYPGGLDLEEIAIW